MTAVLEVIGDGLLILAAFGLIVFAASYAGFFNWRKTAPGRAVMGLVVMLILTLVYNLANILTEGMFPGREYVRILLYGVAVFACWRLVWTLWKSWRETPVIEPKP